MTGTLEQNGMAIGDDLGGFITPNVSANLRNQVIVERAPILISNDAWSDSEKRAAYEFWASIERANKWSEELSLYTGNLKAAAPNDIIQEISSDMAAGEPFGAQPLAGSRVSRFARRSGGRTHRLHAKARQLTMRKL